MRASVMAWGVAVAAQRTGQFERTCRMSQKPTFEEAMKALEAIVDELEAGELVLDESLAKYETGVKMYRVCHKLLEGAEQKVKKLLKDDENRFHTEDLEQEGVDTDRPSDPAAGSV